MEESRSRDPGTKGKRERIADMAFIAIGSERLSPPPPTPLAVQSRQTRIRHKHRCSYRRLPAPVFPITIMLTTTWTALFSLTDMIYISFFRKKHGERCPFPLRLYAAISRSWFRNYCVTWKLLDTHVIYSLFSRTISLFSIEYSQQLFMSHIRSFFDHYILLNGTIDLIFIFQDSLRLTFRHSKNTHSHVPFAFHVETCAEKLYNWRALTRH